MIRILLHLQKEAATRLGGCFFLAAGEGFELWRQQTIRINRDKESRKSGIFPLPILQKSQLRKNWNKWDYGEK